jgi:hypothetical protein
VRKTISFREHFPVTRQESTAATTALILFSLLSGCVSPVAYREPITRFQEASTIVIECVRTQYAGVNRDERDLEIEKRFAKRERITLADLDNNKLTLLGPDDLEARMAILDALAKHGQLLLTLASSDAPTKAKDAANSLDHAITNLTTSLGQVAKSRFKDKASGFASLAAEAAELALNHKIDKALDASIIASESNVLSIITLLREEMGELYQRKRNRLSQARVTAVDAYDQELLASTHNDENLRKAVEKIKVTDDAWGKLPLLLGAGPGLDAMGKAHEELVAYARSTKRPQDLSELVQAVDSFVVRAKVVADAVKTIREANE